jgi:hypothetical protein
MSSSSSTTTPISSTVSIAIDNDAFTDAEDFVNLTVTTESTANSTTTTTVADRHEMALQATIAALIHNTSRRKPPATAVSSAAAPPPRISSIPHERLVTQVNHVLMYTVLPASSSSSSSAASAPVDDAVSAPRSAQVSASRRRAGSLFLSTYRLRFGNAWQIALSSIANVEKSGGPGMQSSAWFGAAAPADSPPALLVYSRDPRPPVRFEFATAPVALDHHHDHHEGDGAMSRCAFFDLVVALAFPHSLRHSFALQRREAAALALSSPAADDPLLYTYDADLDADLDLMGIARADAPCSCHRVLSVLDSPVGALSATPSPSPSPPPPAFSRFVQGLFSAEAAPPEVISVSGGGATAAGSEQPSPSSTPELAAALSVEEALAETRRLFPRCLRCSGWRVSRVNANGAVCPTYPDRLVVPAALADADIAAAAAHRSSQRFVVLGYRHAASGGVIMRASQPRVGIGGHRHRGDELLVAAARRACVRADDAGDGAQLLIVDARPIANAMANMALGGGYESTQQYVHCSLTFLGIANIHAVKTNLGRVTAACGDDGSAPDCARVTLAAGPWLEQLRRLLEGAQTTAQHVDGGGAVLLHCSDGWDRTPQLLILARVLLDSNARTARGLCALLRQQWLALGHKSTERLGLCERGDSKEQSPVLLQLLEALWNVFQQHPSAFEFTPKFLALLLHYSTSVRFASFFGNNERERVALGVYRQRDACLWRYLLGGEAEREHGAWSNPLYDSVQTSGAPLRLAVGGCDVRLWTAMHRRSIDGASALEAGEWQEIPLTFDSEGAVLRRVRMLVRSRDDFQIQ